MQWEIKSALLGFTKVNKARLDSSQPAFKKSKAGGLKSLIREVLSDSDDEFLANATPTTSIGDPSRPWRAEFLSYLETIEATPPAGMTTIQWWGVCTMARVTCSIHADINFC